jgi:hypothetical protein
MAKDMIGNVSIDVDLTGSQPAVSQQPRLHAGMRLNRVLPPLVVSGRRQDPFRIRGTISDAVRAQK